MRDGIKINTQSKSQCGYYLMKMSVLHNTRIRLFFFYSCQRLLINSLKLLNHYVMREPNHLVASVSTSPPRQRH